MASRVDLARLVVQLRQAGIYSDFVQILQSKRDDILHRIMYEGTLERDNLVGEARAYDVLLSSFIKNENP